MRARTRERVKRSVGIVALALTASLLSLPAAQAVTSSADCGGAVIKKASGTPWVCTFGDDFNGNSLDATKWSPLLTSESAFGQGSACYVNDPSTISVGGGVLSLTAQRVAKPFYCASPSGAFATSYTGATVSTYLKFSQAYGRYEIRAKFPGDNVPGTQSSLWMWPAKPSYQAWPWSGEIDIAEWYSQYADRVIPYLHYGNSGWDSGATNNNCLVSDVSGWHTYAMEWTSSLITITYDGQLCTQSYLWPYLGGPFNQPFMIALSQLIGSGSNAPTAATVLPATTQIDYVRVWS
ncbi:MAG: hypothetical protein JWR52_1031 [Marmoricola sp.]|nr:hypothetical protein [Marmoricola sp.]